MNRPVIGIGELLWDMMPAGRQLGGAPGIFAYHVAAQGLPAVPVTAVGDDPDGHDLLAELRARGIDTRHVCVVPYPTGRVDIQLDASGKPTYEIHRDVAWDHIPLTDDLLDLAASAQAICFGTLAQRHIDSRRTIRSVLAAAPAGCLKVFDVNLRGDFYDEPTLRSGLEDADVLKLSDEELPAVAGLMHLPTDEAAFADAVLERFGLDLLVLTRGGEGSLLKTATDSHQLTGTQIQVASTVGAGDAFTAGVVCGWLKGLPLAELHDFAARLASFACTQPGAMPKIPPELRLG